MLNKKQLFALLLVGSLSSGFMYAGDADAAQEPSSSSSSASAAPAQKPGDQPKGIFGFIHAADNYLNYGNTIFDKVLARVQTLGVKSRLAVYAVFARIAYASRNIIAEEATNVVDSVKRTVGLGHDEDTRSAEWDCAA